MTTTEEIIVLSFSQQQIAHFRAPGFVVLPGLLDDSQWFIADDPRLFQGAGDPR